MTSKFGTAASQHTRNQEFNSRVPIPSANAGFFLQFGIHRRNRLRKSNENWHCFLFLKLHFGSNPILYRLPMWYDNCLRQELDVWAIRSIVWWGHLRNFNYCMVRHDLWNCRVRRTAKQEYLRWACPKVAVAPAATPVRHQQQQVAVQPT